MQLRCGRIRRESDDHDVRSVVADDVGGLTCVKPKTTRQETPRRREEIDLEEERSSGEKTSTARELVGRKGVLCGVT